MRSITIAAALLFATSALAQEKYVGSDASVRTILSFKVSPSAIQKGMPAGWNVDAPTSGPLEGYNLRLTLIDPTWFEDAQGKPIRTPRVIVIGVPVKKAEPESSGMMIFGGLTGGAAPGAYGVYSTAKTAMQRSILTQPDGQTTVNETWDANGSDGDAIQLQLSYLRGTVVRSKIEAKVYSGAKPDFYRIYRYTQAADALRENGKDSDRIKSFSFKATGPKLSQFFDGSEQLVGITALPYYSRQVSLPGS
jgi:hypothetical protein